MTRRWRPSLAFVLGGALAGTLALSFAGLVALRYLGPAVGFRNAALILGAAILAATAVLGWLLVRLLLRPITALERYAAAHHAGTSALTQPPGHFGTRELHRTATGVIAMAEALRDREATIRSFTDHVSHELKGPVSVIRAAVELLDEGRLAPADRALLARIDGAGTQIEAQLQALRDAAQAREARYLGAATLDAVVAGLAREHPQANLEVSGADVPLPMAVEGLRIVLGQMLRNAVEHGARAVRLSAEGGYGRITLTVADDGTGISDGNAARIFDPFFTTRREDGGTGMGLAIVRNILRAHGAEIGHVPTATGTTFRLTFAADRTGRAPTGVSADAVSPRPTG